jgi:hypothetical protein
MITSRTKFIDNSDLKTRYTDPDKGGPYTVKFDQWFTRRKRFHCIEDRAGGVVFRSRAVTDIVNWLALHDALSYNAHTEGAQWVVSMKPPPKRKGKKS